MLVAADISRMLSMVGREESEASMGLLPSVYEELHRLAASHFQRQNAGHTLQPTALVNEVYLKMAGSEASANDREHFLAIAATAMRQILVDHERGKRRLKRGGDMGRVTLSGNDVSETAPIDLVDLERALRGLAALDPRKSQVVTMRYFGGLSESAVASVLGVSRRTVSDDWAVAKAWLKKELHPGCAADAE